MDISNAIADRAIEWAKDQVPYRHRGMTRRGCDCTGLIIGIARELKLLKSYTLPMYKMDWNLHNGASDIITRELERVAVLIPKEQLQRGDVVVFRFGKCNAHVGIYLENNLFIHSRAKQKCKYGCLQKSEWGTRWTMIYRFNERKMSKFL